MPEAMDGHLRSVLDGSEHLLFDGAMGTMLQKAGLEAGALPELLCLENPDAITAIHRAYVEAGSQVVTTNTFGANSRKLDGAATVAEVFAAAVECARGSGARYVAADIGPTGALLEPLGTLPFDEAYDLFAEQVIAARDAQADIIVIETMADLLEAKAAVLAAKENCDLPVFATMTFGEDGRTFLGTSPQVAAITLCGLGVDAVGINCSLGPDALVPLLRQMAPYATCPLMVQANAGLPRSDGQGGTIYGIGPDEYAAAASDLLDAGAVIVGGCCGTDPDYIRRLSALIAGHEPCAIERVEAFTVASAQNAVVLPVCEQRIAVIGERINPTGKPRLKEALRNADYDTLCAKAIEQAEAGADILDVNVGLPELDEPVVLAKACMRIQASCPLPLQIDSSDPAAIEAAVRRYSGKPLINSVNASQESLQAILPLAAKYGCAVVGLTLDEAGIPKTADERVRLAKRIVEAAHALGIPRSDIAIDCLVMTASTNQDQPAQILQAVRRVNRELGVKTVLGVSNVSFGLPQRGLINAVFLANAFSAGLDLPIINPNNARMADVVAAQKVLIGQDEGCAGFIADYAQRPDPYAAGASVPVSAEAPKSVLGGGSPDEGKADDVFHLIVTGRKASMREATRALLAEHDPLEVIDDFFIPALDEVGERYESGAYFLPQLMASAEAAKAGFDAVKDHVDAQGGAAVGDKGRIIVATVRGDIHDIGKNIVKMLLENYGYRVFDLGRDVEPQAILDAVQQYDVHLVGLSALMTTTVRSMEETITLLHDKAPDAKVFVGGAVIDPEYARLVGADWYAKDAAESARIAGEFFTEHPDVQ